MITRALDAKTKATSIMRSTNRLAGYEALAKELWAEADTENKTIIGTQGYAIEMLSLEKGELYAVATNICEQIEDMVQGENPRHILEQHDIPTEAGWVWFETPMGLYTQEVQEKIFADVAREFSPEEAQRMFELNSANPMKWTGLSWFSSETHINWMVYVKPGDRTNPEPYIWGTWYFGKELEAIGKSSDTSVDAAVNNLLGGFFNFINSEAVKTQSTTAPRAAQKRAERVKISTEVNVVSLRRTARKDTSEESGRKLTVQYWVSGFWRNQWYPSLGTHRPVRVMGHWRGPEDAPISEKTRVFKIHK